MKHLAGAACAFAFVAQTAMAGTVVDDKALSDTKDGANWLSYGRDYSEQRYSPLDQVNTKTISRLGLQWVLPLPNDRPLLGTPLVVDGVLYFSGSYNVTRAVDARTGTVLWEYDPHTVEHAGDRLRLIWGTSRGVGFWKDTLIIITGDGRLIGLDAKDGHEKWTQQTTDVTKPLYVTGYPKIFHGKVLVGNGGTENGPARGYVTAYDAETGKQAWRFYIVPGNPADGFEDDTQAMAAKTWTGEWWKHGGGGNTWNGFTYDAELNQIIIGTGNGSPWNRKVRSPGGGDNLFLCSLVALDADTGKYRWHFQTAPGETWDYNSSMDIVLADLKIKGRKVKALLHAPKNGFFYVLDRTNGKFISAGKFAKTTWASTLDPTTGRPIEVPGARYEKEPATIWPGPFGAHNWHAMSFSPRTGLAYIPKIELGAHFDDSETEPGWESPRGGNFDPAVGIGLGNDIPKNTGVSSLLAWDPVKQKKVWEVPEEGFWNPGTMATAGDLVFQGRIDGHLLAYNARTGQVVWDKFLGLGISAPPITYQLDGKQYISILVGWGGAGVSFAGGSAVAAYGWAYRAQTRRLFTFALDGREQMPTFEPPVFPKPIVPSDFKIEPDRVAKGQELFVQRCTFCHGSGAVSGGAAPDLRASPIPLDHDAMKAIVIGGGRKILGMPQFKDLSEDDLDSIRHYIRNQARKTAHSLDPAPAPAQSGGSGGPAS